MSNPIPNDRYVIIIGSMKSGTTYLYDSISRHPKICSAVKKEPEFFSRIQNHGIKNVKNYCDLWNYNSSIHEMALEASTGYTKFPMERDVAKRMYEYGIRPKFIYVVRDPFERTESQYNMQWKTHPRIRSITHPQNYTLSKYYMQLQQYLEYYDKSDILLVDFKELKQDSKMVFEKVFRFVGLAPVALEEDRKTEKNESRYESDLIMRLKQARIDRYARVLPDSWRQFAKERIRRISPARRRRLTSRERDFLHEKFKEDMARLENTFGFNVRQWGF